ncbi:hypothetical protein ACFVZR_13405 [Streptomyces sp. NPDC058316]|uniref:hypothetical protein n=1 Tax=unclassified Streptomyces TaxID=2593676 RepID=UPI003428EEB6
MTSADRGTVHAPDHVDMVTVRRDAAAPTGETTVVRLLSLLPAHWSCTPRSVGPDRIALRIALAPAVDRLTVRRALSCALADRALEGWAEER